MGFYGHPVAHRRCESWALLDQLHNMDDFPWLLMGDLKA